MLKLFIALVGYVSLTSATTLAANNATTSSSLVIEEAVTYQPIVTDPFYGQKVGNLTEYINKVNQSKNKLKPLMRAFTAPRSTVGDLIEARYYASHAGLSYCSDAVLAAWDCKHCHRMGKNFEVKATLIDNTYAGRALLGVDHTRKVILLTFRGSVNTKNWLENLKFDKTNYPNVKGAQVHIGFMNSHGGLMPHYLRAFEKLLSELGDAASSYKVLATGHSSGGAIAQLAVPVLQEKFNLSWSQLHLFTFGQPRIGNPAYAAWFNSLPFTSSRIVNENDIVVHTPPNFANYYHSHTEVYILRGVAKACRITDWEDNQCGNSRVPFVSIAAHMLAWDVNLGSDGC